MPEVEQRIQILKGQTMMDKALHKTKDRTTPTAVKHKAELRSSGRVKSSCSIRDISHLVVNRLEIIWYGNRFGHQSMWMNRNNINKKTM